MLNFLSSHISRYGFNKIVNKHNGDKGVRTLSKENMFKVMLYDVFDKGLIYSAGPSLPG